MIKKQLVLICVLICLLSCGIYASADSGDNYADDIAFLEAVGVIRDYKDGNFAPGGQITRAELAMLSVSALGLDDSADSAGISYFDVPAGYWASGYIAAAARMNIMVGYNGFFEPDEAVNIAQAAKVMVQMLGYEQKALAKGGYPSGYLAVANQLSILDGVDTEGEFTRGKAARMLYNTLHTYAPELEYMSSDSASYVTGGTSLMEQTLDIIPDEGRVQANYITSLWGDTACRENELLINDIKFTISDESYNNFIGREVEYYYRDGARKNLIYCVPKYDDSKVYEIFSNDILSSDLSFGIKTFVYINESGKAKKENIERAVIFINGKIPGVSLTKKDLAPADGKVVLIDDDNNGTVDIVFVEEWKTVIAATVNLEVGEILDKTGNGTVNCSTEDSRIVRIVKDGKNVLLSSLKEWDVLLVSESRDKKYIKIMASSATAEGRVSSYEEDVSVTVGEKEYRINPIFSEAELMMNESMTFRLDSEGRIAYSEHDSYSNGGYAYLFDAMKKDSMGSRLMLKIMDHSGEIKVMETQDYVKFNSEGKLGGDELYGRLCPDGGDADILIVYVADNEGFITQLYTPQENSKYLTSDYPEAIRSYSKASNVFGLYESRAFYIDGNAPIFYIVKGEPEDSKIITTDFLIDKDPYTVVGYNAGETMTPKAMVIKVEPGAAGNMSITYETPVGVIDRVSKALNEKGDEVPLIYIHSGGQELKLFANEPSKINTKKILYPARTQSDIDFSEFKRGDLIYYNTDYNGNIDAMCRVLPYSKDGKISSELEWIAEHGWSNEKVFGTLERMSGNLIELSVNGEIYMFPISGAAVTVVNVGEDDIYTGGADELIPANLDPARSSKVYLKVGAGLVYDVVIFNNWR